MECKRIRDNIYKMCVRQGHLEWFRSVEADEARFQRLISVYDKQVPIVKEGKDKGKRKGRFSVATYRDKYERSTHTIRDAVDELLPKDDYVNHYVGKGWTAARALAEWDEEAAELTTTCHDYKNGVLRIRVAVHDYVTFRDMESHYKSVELDTIKKNATEDEVDRMMNDTQTGHLTFAGHAIDIQQTARQMAMAGSTSMEVDGDDSHVPAFLQGIGDVKQWMEDAKLSSDEEDEDGEGAENAVDENGTPIKKEPEDDKDKDKRNQKGNSKQFDRDNEIHKAHRVWLASINKMEEDLTQQIDTSKTLLRETEKLAGQDSQHYRLPFDLLRSRIITACLVQNGAAEPLSQFIADFNDGTDGTYDKFAHVL